MALGRPFAHLNLRRNPFGEPDRRERAALAVGKIEPLQPGELVQFIGDSGRGKTTHLLKLSNLHPGAIYERLDEGQDRCRARVPKTAVYLLDEAQRVRPKLLRRVLARTSTVALGTHEDLSGATDRPIRTIRVGGLTVEKLAAVVERRIEWARREGGPVPVVPPRTLEALIARRGDDLRGIEGDLYDLFQDLEGIHDVEL